MEETTAKPLHKAAGNAAELSRIMMGKKVMAASLADEVTLVDI